jgi:hypothetical protein
MSEEEKRRCCLLGGCGCGPDQQVSALAEEIALSAGWKSEDGTISDEHLGTAYRIAKATFDIFGYGPFKARLHELGLDKGDGKD